MKPSAFEYFTPNTVKEAVGLLEKYEDEAKILAGGQSLVPIRNFRRRSPSPSSCIVPPPISKKATGSIMRRKGVLKCGNFHFSGKRYIGNTQSIFSVAPVSAR